MTDLHNLQSNAATAFERIQAASGDIACVAALNEVAEKLETRAAQMQAAAGST